MHAQIRRSAVRIATPERLPRIHGAARDWRTCARCFGNFALVCLGSLLIPGCYSIQNGWLDPTTLGRFTESATMNIRTSLTLEDTPPGIPGAEPPAREDLAIIYQEHAISAGDTLAIEIHELRDRFVPYAAQVLVSSTGHVNIPVIGRISAIGITVPEFEAAVRDMLVDKGILVEPQVTVNPVFLQQATYSVFGIGVSAANNAPLRAGTFPIRRPDLNILEAINQVGGLNEFVTDVYVFRYDEPSDTPQGEFDASSGTVPTDSNDGHFEGDSQIPAPPGAQDRDRNDHDIHREDDPADDDERAALLEAVPPPQQTNQDTEQVTPAQRQLEPAQTPPYIYVDGEFVPNPAYNGDEDLVSDRSAPPPVNTFESATPIAAWSRLAGDSTYRIIRIEADRLRNGDPEVNIYVRAGDVIRIVSGEIGVYYVMGQVNRVGPFAFNSEPITLKAAIAAAGGLSPLAWPDRCTVYRRLGQREQMIQVNLDRVFAGKDPDFLIRRGDIVNVGTHPFAPYLQRIRQASLPNPSTAVGYGFTYTRNFADIDSFAVKQNPANRPSRFPGLFP